MPVINTNAIRAKLTEQYRRKADATMAIREPAARVDALLLLQGQRDMNDWLLQSIEQWYGFLCRSAGLDAAERRGVLGWIRRLFS